jgi:integrase/recombinase XerD
VKLVLATRDLVREGRTFEGFPLLLEDDCTPAEPVQTFLWHALVDSGSVSSRLTWECYGRWLYDYFQFLQLNGLRWDQEPGPGVGNPLTRYRQWCLDEVGISRRTVNLHVGLARRFYEWAFKEQLIEHLPVTYRRAYAPHDGFLSHVHRGSAYVASSSIRETKKLPDLLTMDQVRYCRMNLTNESHRLMFELMVQVGLRSCESRTFQLSSTFNPRLRKDLPPGVASLLPVDLDPKHMWIKYEKPRTVHVPRPLMESLHAYVLHRREGLRLRSGVETNCLLLNAAGHPFSKSAVVEVFTALEARVGFRVRAHMLRHTYATHILRALRKSADFTGEPLLYVRDRLGHSSVQTTAIYLHLINQLEAEMVLAHEDYVDELFARA